MSQTQVFEHITTAFIYFFIFIHVDLYILPRLFLAAVLLSLFHGTKFIPTLTAGIVRLKVYQKLGPGPWEAMTLPALNGTFLSVR